jgi:hypothetical protein
MNTDLAPLPPVIEGISATPAAGWWVISDSARLGERHVWHRRRVCCFAVVSSDPFDTQAVVPLVAGTQPDGTAIGAPVLELAGSGFLRHDTEHTVCECEDFHAGITDPAWCHVCAGVRA